MIQFGVKFDTFWIRVQAHFKFLTGCWSGMTGRGMNWVASWQNCTLEVHLWSFVCPWTPWGCMVSYLSFCISEGCSSAPSKHFCHPALTWTLLLIVTRQFMQHNIPRNADSEDWQCVETKSYSRGISLLQFKLLHQNMNNYIISLPNYLGIFIPWQILLNWYQYISSVKTNYSNAKCAPHHFQITL